MQTDKEQYRDEIKKQIEVEKLRFKNELVKKDGFNTLKEIRRKIKELENKLFELREH